MKVMHTMRADLSSARFLLCFAGLGLVKHAQWLSLVVLLPFFLRAPPVGHVVLSREQEFMTIVEIMTICPLSSCFFFFFSFGAPPVGHGVLPASKNHNDCRNHDDCLLCRNHHVCPSSPCAPFAGCRWDSSACLRVYVSQSSRLPFVEKISTILLLSRKIITIVLLSAFCLFAPYCRSGMIAVGMHCSRTFWREGVDVE